jgi:imidazolonepropionase-like amidohydrolase
MPNLSILKHPVWLRVGTLLDGSSTQPLKNANLVYDTNQILFVGSASELPKAELLKAGQTAPDLELPNHTILPGLIEAHAHLFLEGGELDVDKRTAYLKQSPAELLSHALTRFNSLVRIGICAVRDAGDKDGVGLALARIYESDHTRVLPYLDSPGAAIHHRGRYGSFMADPLENHQSLEDCVSARIRAGADRIKLIPTGIINFQKGAVTTEPQMTSEEVQRLVRASRALRKQTFAHASGDKGIDRALDGSVDSVEHGFFVRDDQLARMRDENIAWVPTFAPVQAQVDHAERMRWDDNVVSNLKNILENHAASLVKAHSMGVKIIAGSDAGSYAVPHAAGLYYELELMERAGLPTLGVINSATGVPSERLAFKQKLGQIKPGYLPRFLLLQKSVLETVRDLSGPKTVIFDGHPHNGLMTSEASGL